MLNESIIKIRVELQNSKIKKSGKNKFAGFNYYELADFLPKLNELMLKEGINDQFYITNEYAVLELIKGEERQKYTIPFKIFETPVNTKIDNKTGEVKKVKSMQDIQYLGALNTYYKRYLYLNAFGITDGEVIDSMNNEIEEITEETALNYVVNFGKYAGKTLKEIKEVQPTYLEYLRQKGDEYLQMCVNIIYPIPSEEEQTEILFLMQQLSDLLVQTNTDRDKFYNYYKVTTNSEMTKEQLKDAIEKLKQKLE